MKKLIMLIGFTMMVFCSANVAGAVDTNWTGTNGDWFSNNWSIKIPGPEDNAIIDNSGTVNVSGGNAEAYRVFVGDWGNGSMNLLSGQLTVSNNLYIGNYSEGTLNQSGGDSSNDLMFVGITGYGIYNLSGGSMTSNRQIYGTFDGYAVMNQSEGVNSSNHIEVGNDTGFGFYNISGGTLMASEMTFGDIVQGQFNINDSAANIIITDRLFFNVTGYLTSVPGSIINMEGASLDNANTNQYNLWGFNNLNMVFNGGSGISTIEVAGQDVGAGWSGSGNFAFDTLTIGNSSPADVQLVNNRTNMGGTEALYANNCIFGAGSTLDLNGINLYCNNIIDNGATINYNGGQLIQSTVVPEPISSILFVTGGSFLAGRRYIKRKKTA